MDPSYVGHKPSPINLLIKEIKEIIKPIEIPYDRGF